MGVLGHSTVSADPSGVTALLQSMTDSSPVVVVVDDAHLADEDSLVAVTLAARHLAGRPLLVIFASRSRPWMTGERLFATIGPLVSEQARTVLEVRPVEGRALGGLVESVLDAVPDERLTGYLSERTRGNALLVRETVNALHTAGALRIEQGIGYLVDDSPPQFPRLRRCSTGCFPGTTPSAHWVVWSRCSDGWIWTTFRSSPNCPRGRWARSGPPSTHWSRAVRCWQRGPDGTNSATH